MLTSEDIDQLIWEIELFASFEATFGEWADMIYCPIPECRKPTFNRAKCPTCNASVYGNHVPEGVDP